MRKFQAKEIAEKKTLTMKKKIRNILRAANNWQVDSIGKNSRK